MDDNTSNTSNGSNGSVTVTFYRRKTTPNTVVYQETTVPGKPKIIGSLYLQDWFAGDAQEITVTVTIKK